MKIASYMAAMLLATTAVQQMSAQSAFDAYTISQTDLRGQPVLCRWPERSERWVAICRC